MVTGTFLDEAGIHTLSMHDHAPEKSPARNIYPLDSLHGSHLDIADLFSLIVATEHGYIATGSSLAVIGISYIVEVKS